MGHDAAQIQVPPPTLAVGMNGMDHPSAVPAARDPMRGSDIDDDTVFLEFEADHSGGLEGDEDLEYAGGAHRDRWVDLVFGDFKDTPFPVRPFPAPEPRPTASQDGLRGGSLHVATH